MIYYIDLKTVSNRDIVEKYIYPNMELNYYWSDSFDCEFYVKLCRAGFISTSAQDINDNTILLPEIQFTYAVLHFENLHISKKVAKLIKKNEYKFSINSKFDEVITKIDEYHENSWLSKPYKMMLKELKNNSFENFELCSVELIHKETKELISAEIGYKIGKTYTSLTGFCRRQKEYNNWGKLQLVLLCDYIKNEGFDFWNLGHASLQYKIDLGATVYERADFLEIWRKSSKS